MYAISGAEEAKLWRLDRLSQRNLTQHQWTVFGVAVSPDGKYLASSEGTRINVWDLATRSILYIIAETTHRGCWWSLNHA